MALADYDVRGRQKVVGRSQGSIEKTYLKYWTVGLFTDSVVLHFCVRCEVGEMPWILLSLGCFSINSYSDEAAFK